MINAPSGRQSWLAAVRDYQRIRDHLSEPLFDVTERIAGYHWDLVAVREQLRELSRAMRPEIDTLLELDTGQPAHPATQA